MTMSSNTERERFAVLRSITKYVMRLAGDDRDFSTKAIRDVLGARDERDAIERFYEIVTQADALRRQILAEAGVIERPATWGGCG